MLLTYHVNAGTILRDGIDGTWQWASVEWEETIRQLKIGAHSKRL